MIILIQEYSDSHVFTTVYEQNSFAPVARLVWLKQSKINEQVSEQDEQWLTKFNQWVSEQRINPIDRFEYQEDYARKDKLDDILGIKVFYYHNDQLGTPNELTNAKGDVVWAADFEAWGGAYREKYETQTIGTIEVDSTQLQPIRFQGQFYDSETGLHYNRFRYYDNDVGMFISSDPIGLMGGNNVFAYAPNPTGWVDPLGLSSDDVSNIVSNFQNTVDEMTEDGKRLQFTPLNNTYRTFGGGTYDCFEQTEFMTQKLSEGEYDDNWLFVPNAEPGHVWGVAVSSNTEDPYITFDTRADNITLTYDKQSGGRCSTCHGWRLTEALGLWKEYDYINYPQDLLISPSPASED